MKAYDSVAYAQERLLKTFVRVGGRAAEILDIRAGGNVTYLDMAKDVQLAGKYKDMDITPVPLGYCNWNLTATYLMRTPQRKFKQGLTYGSLRSNDGNNPENIGKRSIGMCINGEYPLFKDVLKERGNWARHDINKKAFCRSFAICVDASLEYRGEFKVGEVLGNGNFHLNEDFEWVRESLEEVL